jgi:AcrR family transcriptional regulator
MATRDAESKRRQLLEAALAEFAAHGIAGARVDRVAKEAGVSAGLIYKYFESKEALFDAVFDLIITTTVSENPITPDDLPGYAGRLFDGYDAYPAVARLVTWYRLERADGGPSFATAVASNQDKIAKIARAQKDGLLPSRYPAAELLALVLHIAAFWTAITPDFEALAGRTSRTHRRQVVIDTVTALLRD